MFTGLVAIVKRADNIVVKPDTQKNRTIRAANATRMIYMILNERIATRRMRIVVVSAALFSRAPRSAKPP